MILLLGGTSETAAIVEGLVERKGNVLVSTSTDTPLKIERGEHVSLRTGPLGEEEIVALIKKQTIRVVVDATHPYAEEITSNAQAAALETGTPYFRFLRPESALPDGVHVRDSHFSAASLAFGFGRPVFLTTGSKNLSPYTDEMRRTKIPLVVRILPLPASFEACKRAGVPPERVVSGRGPFSFDENVRILRRHHIGVLVTKNSGEPGGVGEKIEAALSEGCEVVVVSRPPSRAVKESTCSTPHELIRMLSDRSLL